MSNTKKFLTILKNELHCPDKMFGVRKQEKFLSSTRNKFNLVNQQTGKPSFLTMKKIAGPTGPPGPTGASKMLENVRRAKKAAALIAAARKH